eukprot:568280-Amphidinium_carterae.2
MRPQSKAKLFDANSGPPTMDVRQKGNRPEAVSGGSSVVNRGGFVQEDDSNMPESLGPMASTFNALFRSK